ncbi:MAG TPA: GNAT family N-acetyltransferase [Thermoanaerobaculia bacterium]|nr:GNAT family N-acetyltransferase [Thermoanaerobaculia bacterium]
MIRALTAADFDAVFAAFVSAFSDYVVPLQPTREQLQEMLTRRGWVPEASIAAFENDQIVAFTLNGVEGTRGYDSGTGVVPTHRRHGLAREIMRACYPLLREHGCTEYVLEVLEANHRAHALYESEGFAVTRGLQSWKYDGAAGFSPPESFGGLKPAAPQFWDVEPSWQNSPGSIARANDTHVTLGNDDGYVIVFPNTGDVPQLAVRKEARRNGLGTRLLQAAAALAQKPLRIMNVDERDEGIAAFLEHAGATRFVRQLEMVRSVLWSGSEPAADARNPARG